VAKLYRLVRTCARDDLVDLIKVRVLRASETGDEKQVGVEVIVVELANSLAGRGRFTDENNIGCSRLDQKLEICQIGLQLRYRCNLVPLWRPQWCCRPRQSEPRQAPRSPP
jgi:hypothetical protein